MKNAKKWHKNTLDNFSFRSKHNFRSSQTFSASPTRFLDSSFTPTVRKLSPTRSVSRSPNLRSYLNIKSQSTPNSKSHIQNITIKSSTARISIIKSSPMKSQFRYTKSIKHFNSIHPSRRFKYQLVEPGAYITILKGMPILEEIKNFREKSSSRLSEISKKHYIDLNNSVIKTVSHLKADQEEFSSISFEEPYRHNRAREYFRLIKSGLYDQLEEALDKHTHLISTVDTVIYTQTQQTGLHWAAKRNNLKITKLLVSRNIKIYAVDMMGRKAQDIALKRGNLQVYNYLNSLKQSKVDPVATQNRRKMRRQLLLPSKTLISEALAGRAKKSKSFLIPRSETSRLSPVPSRVNIKRHSMVPTTAAVFHFKTAQVK